MIPPTFDPALASGVDARIGLHLGDEAFVAEIDNGSFTVQRAEPTTVDATLQTDAATLRAYRDRYREGIPRRPIADEEADARVLYRALAEIGGPEIVGSAQELDPGTFYRPIPGD